MMMQQKAFCSARTDQWPVSTAFAEINRIQDTPARFPHGPGRLPWGHNLHVERTVCVLGMSHGHKYETTDWAINFCMTRCIQGSSLVSCAASNVIAACDVDALGLHPGVGSSWANAIAAVLAASYILRQRRVAAPKYRNIANFAASDSPALF